MNTCDHCNTELSYGQCHIEGTVVACNACGWASPMMERRYLDLSPSKETLASVAMTLDLVFQGLVRAEVGRSLDYEHPTFCGHRRPRITAILRIRIDGLSSVPFNSPIKNN
jgi:hypothetical protein